MFDLGLTKLALISVVALVVIGPKRLPRVARTIGGLFGRAQRVLHEIKGEIAREIELEDLKKAKAAFEEIEETTQSVKHTVDDQPTLTLLARRAATRKKYWRAKRLAPTARIRTYAQSGAARMARHKSHKSSKMRQPIRFF